MSYYADLHIHSPYTEGASPLMSFRTIEQVALKKGIAVMGTGDCFHPVWAERIEDMEEDLDSGLLVYKDKRVQFLPTVEVSCIFGKKRIHVLLIFKNMRIAWRVQKKLKGNADPGGRPALYMTVSQLMDEVKGDFEETIVVFAHLLHPQFGAMGHGNRYDETGEVSEILPDAIETGISADVGMIRGMKGLDKIGMGLVSFSDAYSPESIGREVTEFYQGGPSWESIRNGIIKRQIDTIEYPPPLGKFFYSGHRKCGYSTGVEGVALCPVCRKRITMGVEQRLSDLEAAPWALKERYMVPLKKLIELSGLEDVELVYEDVLKKSPYQEIDLLINSSYCGMKVGNPLIDVMEQVRSRQIGIIPGYDGQEGKLVDMRKLLNEKMERANLLFESDVDHTALWKKAERIQELMMSGNMTVTKAEHEELLSRGVPEPL